MQDRADARLMRTNQERSLLRQVKQKKRKNYLKMQEPNTLKFIIKRKI